MKERKKTELPGCYPTVFSYGRMMGVFARSTSVTTIDHQIETVWKCKPFFETWDVDSHFQIKRGKSQTEKQTTQNVVS